MDPVPTNKISVELTRDLIAKLTKLDPHLGLELQLKYSYGKKQIVTWKRHLYEYQQEKERLKEEELATLEVMCHAAEVAMTDRDKGAEELELHQEVCDLKHYQDTTKS
jgi:hypothetical protein